MSDFKRLAAFIGFEVTQDSDQPGMWVWWRMFNGERVDACDASLGSEQEAWDEVEFKVNEFAMTAFDLSSDDWDGMASTEREAKIKQAFFEDVDPASDTRFKFTSP
jgi:hypothetical protein